MLERVQEQYECYPYPARDPQAEQRRLLLGSPSDPLEIDHFLFGGKRDWSKPFRVLVAGGGTGDALIQLAARLEEISCPAEILYLDLSEPARQIAEARAKVRGFTNIEFNIADLLDAPKFGPFDYIDCTGVLHHLANPQDGFDALSAALASDGGIGMMVYALYGRSGVYALQNAFSSLLAFDAPVEKLAAAREILPALPETHCFRTNPNVSDHRISDAGFYDLLLHSQDKPFCVPDILSALAGSGLRLASFTVPALYDPAELLPKTPAMAARLGRIAPAKKMALAEQLRGSLSKHIFYAQPDALQGRVAQAEPDSVPRLNGGAHNIAIQVAAEGRMWVRMDRGRMPLDLPRESSNWLGLASGENTLNDIAAHIGMRWEEFLPFWRKVEAPLLGYGILHYSKTVSALGG